MKDKPKIQTPEQPRHRPIKITEPPSSVPLSEKALQKALARLDANDREKFLQLRRLGYRLTLEEDLAAEEEKHFERVGISDSLQPTGTGKYNPKSPGIAPTTINIVAISTLDGISLGVAKRKKIASSFERFLDAVGVESPEIRQTLTKQILPLVEAVTAPKPGSINWPKETYSEAHKKRGVNIVQFLEDETVGWIQLIRAGQVDLRTLRRHDPTAAGAVNNYQKRNKLPDHIKLPTLKESNDAALASEWVKGTDVPRLVQARRRRLGGPKN